MIIELECKSALNKVRGSYPYSYDLNIYRGCSHGCKYCYALYSHKYLEGKEFYTNVYVKKGILPLLDKELGRIPRDKIVNIGSVCDSYQPAEATQALMPEVLKLFIKHRAPVTISTKSDLILRDIDLIAELSSLTYVNIAASVITTDDALAKRTEPGSAPPMRRIAMLAEIKKRTKASTGLHCMPILPFITDGEENLRSVFSSAKRAGVDYVLTGGLNMRGETGTKFIEFIRRSFPEVYPQFTSLRQPEHKKEYKAGLSALLKELYSQYGMSPNYRKAIDKRLQKQSYFSF